jgi:hypothetical protein
MSSPYDDMTGDDLDAYGPSDQSRPVLPLPSWDPTTDRERRAFVRWCCAMLEREAREQDMEPAIRELQSNEEGWRLLRDLVDRPVFDRLLLELPHLSWDDFKLNRYGIDDDAKKNPRAPGIKPNLKVAAALIDNARLTVLFKHHFDGKYRRPSAPGRIAILQKRHDLADHECDMIQRKVA